MSVADILVVVFVVVGDGSSPGVAARCSPLRGFLAPGAPGIDVRAVVMVGVVGTKGRSLNMFGYAFCACALVMTRRARRKR